MDEKKNEEKVQVRHTINAEETFTLAKDVYDIRTLIKNVYGNRAVIARRLNILSLSVSLVFTLLYIAYILFTGLLQKLNSQNFGMLITLYCILGIYGALFIALIVITMCSIGANSKNIKKYNKVLKFIRLGVRFLSLIMTIIALVYAMTEDYAAKSVALDIVLIIFSIVCMIFQIIPIICGGLGKLARWLLSPVKIKCRFSKVALEWYELAVASDGESKKVKRVAQKYHDEIGIYLDNFLIPALGKKYVSTIKPAQILNVVENVTEDRAIVEGILKNIFAYATECGYVTFDPCKDLEFEGSIEEEEKPKKTIKSRFAGIGKKIGMSILNKYIDSSIEPDDNK